MEDNRIQKLKKILLDAQSHGLDVSNLLQKVDDSIGHQKSKTIKIVLMGAFSDGKTTAIAAMTGQLESNMKIAIEESSDELAFYHLPALGYDFEIVDTPGLFGTKEKEVKGKQVRYSDVTRDYISQAHMVIYVTEAVNPLKDSHKDILKFVLRDLGKLPNTIFVINKMDNAGYSLLDDEDFSNGEKIKKETFISKLNDIIHLSPEERKSLKVVCMAADPAGRGLADHFTRMDSYLKKSRVNVLRAVVKEMGDSVDKNTIKKGVEQSVLSDLANQTLVEFRNHSVDIDSKIQELKSLEEELGSKWSRLRGVVIANRNGLIQELRSTENEICISVENASMQSLGSVVTQYYGEKGERLSMTIQTIFSKYAESNNAAFQQSHIDVTLDRMGELTKGLISSMTKVLRNTKIGADAVKRARDIFASGFKFKPWGAVNLAGKLSRALVVISIAIDVFMWWKKHSERRKFENAKQELVKCCKDAFKDADQYLNPEVKYFENFAPGLKVVEKAISDTQENLENFKKVSDLIRTFTQEISQWVSGNMNDKVFY